MAETVIELSKITKAFPGVVALSDVSLFFQKGEVHALVGQNGAGKSTLIKIISGAIRPDSGGIKVESKTYNYLTPQSSKELGIGVIYQEFNLVPYLSVAENIFLGDPIRKGILVSKKEMRNRSEEILNELCIELDPDRIVKDLSVAYKQIVEIAKALVRNIRVLIMDEPTAPLTSNEVKALFELVSKLKARGVTIIYISHRLEELFVISDCVSVLRDGKHILTTDTKDISRQEIIYAMVGHSAMEEASEKLRLNNNKVMFEAKEIDGKGIQGASFYLRSGEIVGLAGLIGSGRTELARSLFGAEPYNNGKIILYGKHIHIRTPLDAIKHGIALIPEDRKLHGLLLEMTVRENISIAGLKKMSSSCVIKKKLEGIIVEDLVQSLKIKTPTLMQKVKNLSGGNQQKVVLAKWLATKSEILIFDEPTRGIDVEGKEEIYKLLKQLSSRGKGIIFISSEISELLAIADRIYVLCEGRIVGELNKDEATEDKILDLAWG